MLFRSPYQIDNIENGTLIGINSSSFFDKFSYDIEDIIETGYIDLKKYSTDIDKESMYGLVYRLDGSVLTKTITDEEYSAFTLIRKKGTVSVSEIQKKFKNLNIMELISVWCDEGVLFIVR